MTLLKTLLAVALTLFTACVTAADRPNIVLILMDDMGWLPLTAVKLRMCHLSR